LFIGLKHFVSKLETIGFTPRNF